METKIKQIQIAIFTKNFNISNDLERAALLTDVNQYSGAIFDGQPTQLPIPNGVPQEIPRFVLNSLDGRFSCNIALSRTDVFYNVPPASTESFEQLLAVQKTNARNIFNFLISKGITVNRIGFVSVIEKVLLPEEGGSLDYLKNNFIREGKFNEPKELTFNYNHSSRSVNFEMNNLVTINAKVDGGVSMQTDINTLAEVMDSENFNSENFNEIIDYAIQGTKAFVENFPNV